MRVYVVTEDTVDTELLGALLPEDLAAEVQIVPAGRLSEALAMARSILASRRVPVVLLANSHTTWPELIQETEVDLESLLQIASGGVPCRVVLAVPELEAALFESRDILENILAIQIPPTTAVRAEANPRQALEELFLAQDRIKNMRQLLGAMTSAELNRLRDTQAVAGLNGFLHQVSSPSRQRASA
ncbi:MAG TPA: hypothetical protein VF789_21930 [Thermoanaerobaculia bacterium]